ncbi:BON domain-containing class I SAM-dependent methyltransferase [Sphaerisporangium fuscum]|uniref:BON domain-containing class I SAM-dependent methyltransferase n=1 Tax=Sphaerisporangium fuscum TaxID=2835868 RepID=UPI001BDC5859|nr:BON domain-containing class I SAM-dependent methyltransferase [Sphaerisporangium fuscum]
MNERRRELLDRDLEEAAADLLRHHARLRSLDVRVRFDGGVAHVDGRVDSQAELAVVREQLGRLAGVLAVWDRVSVGDAGPRVADLGCGDVKQHPDNLGFDKSPGPSVDVVIDLRDGVPLADASVDQVFTVHVLEHLPDFLPLLQECHRILRPGGVLHVLAPWWRHVNAVADPTHLRLIDPQTFKHLCRPDRVSRCWYPLMVSRDEATVFADLVPVKPPQRPADERRLARFFD